MSELLAANDDYSASYTRDPTVTVLSKKPYMVITCFDHRIDVPAALGMQFGDAPVARNAGGNVKNAMREVGIVVAAGGVQEIVVVKHTG